MTADEFLALVEKYPQGLYYGAPDDESGEPARYFAGYVPGMSVDEPDPITGKDADAVADAAPALAAAAIRLLRAYDATDVAQEVAIVNEYHAAMTALRAALPEELRP